MTIIFPFLKAENVIKVYLMSFLFVLRTLVHFYVIYKFFLQVLCIIILIILQINVYINSFLNAVKILKDRITRVLNLPFASFVFIFNIF